MEHDTNDHGAGDRRPNTRRWLAACLPPASLVLVAVALTVSSSGAALVPLPTTTAPTRPTTEPPRETTTTTTTSTTTTSSLPTTVPPTENPTTIAAPIPEPPTNPPTSTTQPAPESTSPASSEPPVAAPFIMSAPVVVDPEDPTVQPPVIVGVSPYCFNGLGSADVWLQNIDLFHYPVPFKAAYEWSVSSGTTVLQEGAFALDGWQIGVAYLAPGYDPGTYTFTVTDVDLGSAASADVVIPDCTSQPPPSAGPLPPLVVVAAVTCSDDEISDNGDLLGTGSFLFSVHNQPGDDGSARGYNFDVWFYDSGSNQSSVALGSITPALADNGWAVRGVGKVPPHALTDVHADEYYVTVTDDADPTLQAVVQVEIPPCAPNPPPGDPVAPPYPVTFVDVVTQCADPVLLDGRVDYVLINPNYLVLDGNGILEFKIEWFFGATLVGTSYSSLAAGIMSQDFDDLAPGAYKAELSLSDFPSMTDSVTFTIDDCTAVPQADPPPLALYGITTVCVPGDDAETVLFVVEHQVATTEPFSWRLTGDNGDVGSQALYLAADVPTMLSADHVPAGTYVLTVGNEADLTIAVTASVEVGSCLDQPGEPTDTTDPPDPTQPTEPSDSTEPDVPMQPTDPGDSTPPATSVPPAGPGTESGTLPATGTSVRSIVAVALLAGVGGGAMLWVTRRRPGRA